MKPRKNLKRGIPTKATHRTDNLRLSSRLGHLMGEGSNRKDPEE